jgi:hypothetical protein
MTHKALHDVLKNELAAGVMPCGRFGANAAWLRFAVMTHNVLTGLKRIALKSEWLRARSSPAVLLGNGLRTDYGRVRSTMWATL